MILRPSLRPLAITGAAIALSVAATTALPRAQGNAPYVIGAVLSESGEGANFGQPSADAIRRLVEYTNSRGGVNGHKIELRLQDDGGNTQQARAAFAQLADDKNVVGIIGSSASPASLAIAPVADDKKIVDLTLASSPRLSNPPRPYVFQFPVPTALRAKALFDEMKRRKVSKLAVFVSIDDYGQVSQKILEDGAKAAGIAIVDTERFNPASPNVDSEVTRAKGSPAEAFIVFSQDPGSALVAKAMVNQGVAIPSYADSPAVNEGFLRAAGASASRWIIVTTNIDVADLIPKGDPSYKPIHTLMGLYPAKGAKPNHFSGTGADAYNVLIAALAKAGPDRAKIRDAIETMKGFAGTTGTYNFSPQVHQGVGAEGLKLVSGALVTGRGLTWKLVR